MLVVAAALLYGMGPPADPGRWLPYAPFVVKDDSGHYRGLTLDLIALLNDIQQDVYFVFVPTSAPTATRRWPSAASR